MKLLQSGLSTDDFLEMGFVMEDDGSGSPWGIDYNLRTERFHIIIDCTWEVKLGRMDVDNDYIVVQVDDKFDLQQLVDFVQ